MKRTFTFLMTALFLCVGMVKAAVTDVPEMSTEGNTVWYTISNTRSASGKYLYWTEEGLKDANTLSGASLFYFTGDASACYIHNAATELLFTGDGAWNANGVACALTVSPSEAGLMIGFSGTFLNEKNNGNGFTTWTDVNDAGSIFVIAPATTSIEDAIAKIEENKAAGNTIMGQYKYEEESYNQLVAALATLKTAAPSEAVAAFESCSAAMAALTRVMPEEGKFYVIECPIFKAAQGVSKGLNGTPGWNTIDLTDTNYYWTVEVNNGTYALKNLGTGTYLNGTAMSAAAAYAQLTSLGEQQFNIVVNGTTVHADGHSSGAGTSGNIVSWAGSANSASAWMFIEKADPTSSTEVAVTYSFTYGGEEKYTQTASTLVGEEWPAITVALPYGVSASKPEGTIAAEDHTDGAVTKEIELAVAELPFAAAEDVESISQWYYATMHSNYPKYLEENADGSIDWVKESIEGDNAETLVWGFVGNVFDGIKVVNKATGHAIVSISGAAVMGDAANATAFILSKTDTGVENGFCLKYPASNYLNGSAGKVGSYGYADAGSTFLLEAYVDPAYDLSEVKDAFEAQAMEFAGFVQDNAAFSKLTALKAAEVMKNVETLYGAISAGEKVLKADVVAAMEAMTAAKAEAEPVLAYYPTYDEAYWNAVELLETLDAESEAYAVLSAAINEAANLEGVATVELLEAKVTALNEVMNNLPEDEPEVPELIVWTINQADYPGGEQYAKDEPHVINDQLTIYTTDCHWRTDQLRVYSSTTNNGYFYSNKLPAAIKSIEFTAGYKKDAFVVYGSNDGAEWTKVTEVAVPSTSYTSGLVADFTGTAYNYFKVDVKGTNQVRITQMIITLDPAVKLPGGVVSAPAFSMSSCNLFAPATVELTAAEGNIYWSTDNETFVPYTEAITIDASCTVYAYAEVDGTKSTVATAEYVMAVTYDNVAALLAAEATSTGVPVFVKLEAVVDSFGLNKDNEIVSVFLIEGTDTLMVYDYNIPADYVKGSVVKGQLAGLWKDYKGTLELCYVDYSGATVTDPAYDLSEVKDAFEAQAKEFVGLQGMPGLSSLPAVSEKWAEVMGVVEPLRGSIAAGEKVLKADVVAAMAEMTAVQEVVAYYPTYSEVYYGACDLCETLDPASEDYAALDAVINQVFNVSQVTTVAELEAKAAALNAAVAALYDLDEPIVGEWEDVTYAASPEEWAIIDDAELLGLGSYWEHTGYTNYDNARGVMEFVAGENTSAYLKQDYCPICTPGTYRLTGKAFHKGATNAVMYVQNNETLTVEIPAAVEGASYENAEEYFTTFSIEFKVTSVTQVNVGYSCDFTNAEDFLVVGGFKLEMKSSTSLRNIFMETIMACESLGYQITQLEALHAKQQAVMANAMPIYEALNAGQKVLKSEVEASIEEMETVMAEIKPVREYYMGAFMEAYGAAEVVKAELEEGSEAYATLEAAINEAADVAAVTTVAELEAKAAALNAAVAALYDLDEPIAGEWEDVTYAASPEEWAIIDDAELLGLGSYWEHTGYTNYDNARGVMEFVAGENTSAYLKQDYCPICTPGTYRLTGKAFHKGATNAVMYVQNNETLTVEIPAAAEGASYENAEEHFTTFSIEFKVTSVTQVNVGYSCDFTNAEDFLVVGGFKLEMKSSTSLRNIFMETIMACESLGYQITQLEALHAKQQAVMANAMPIYEALSAGQKMLKSEVEASIEEMETVMAEIKPVAAYYKGEFMEALYAAEDFKLTLDEASQAYTDLDAAINEAADVAAVTTVAELEAKVAALEELMRLIETGIDNIEAETETVIYDLSGRRVTEMTKGGIYIVNGKKVIK